MALQDDYKENIKNHFIDKVFTREFRERIAKGQIPFETVAVMYEETLIDIITFDDGWPACSAAIHMHESGHTWFSLTWSQENGAV